MRLSKRIAELEALVLAGAGGGGRQVSKALSQRNLGKSADQLLAPAITIVATDFTLVEVNFYAEFDDNGTWYTPCVVDNGVALEPDDNPGQPIGTAPTSGAPSGWNFVMLIGQGLNIGYANDSAQGFGTVSNPMSNVLTLPPGSHELGVGVPVAFNAVDNTWPDLVVRNAMFAATVLI